VVIILKGHEAERLQHAIRHIAHRAQSFSHPVDRAGLGLKSDLDEITLRQRLCEAQQPAGCGDGLEFRFGAASVFEANRSQDGISKLDPGSAPRGVRLGEVGHTQMQYGAARYYVKDYGSPSSEFRTVQGRRGIEAALRKALTPCLPTD
jgi:hypothetical protein